MPEPITSANLTAEAVRAALRGISGPGIEGDLSTSRQISEISIRNGQVVFAITVDPKLAHELEPMRQAAERAVSRLPGVSRAIVALTAETRIPAAPAGAPPHAPRTGPNTVPGIRHIIAVASGKGGVGKSTTALPSAWRARACGSACSMPIFTVLAPRPRRHRSSEGRRARLEGAGTLEAFGVKVMSMGFLVEENTAMIWRGPMVMSALQQMLREVAWGDSTFSSSTCRPGLAMPS